MEEENKNEDSDRTTRSGKKIASTKKPAQSKATKRKRVSDQEPVIGASEPNCTKARMSGKDGEGAGDTAGGATGGIPNQSVNFTWEQLTSYMSGEFEKNRKETISSFNIRMDATETSLKNHRTKQDKNLIK